MVIGVDIVIVVSVDTVVVENRCRRRHIIHLDFERCPDGVYMSVCLSVCLIVRYKKMSGINVRDKCPLYGAQRRGGGD